MKIYTRTVYKKLAFSFIVFLSYSIKPLDNDFDPTSITRIPALALVIKNLPIVDQVGYINTTAAQPALSTTLTITGATGPVSAYNTDIATALTSITTAINSPSQSHTEAAIVALNNAINDFNTILADDAVKSVTSMYSLIAINSTLAMLNAQLAYLYILQLAE